MSKKLQAQIDAIKKSIVNKNLTNTSMATYGKLNGIQHSLYRYKQLSNAGLEKEANTESGKLNNLINNFNATEEGTVFQGEISNVKYVWRSSPDSCDECQALDGTEYDFVEDIPDKPHPNCNCIIEEVYENDANNEFCPDCFADLEEFDSIIQDAQGIQDEGENLLDEFTDFVNSDISEQSRQAMSELIDSLSQRIGAYADFLSNYFQLLFLNWSKFHEGSPEYYHQKANCEAAQRGEIGAAIAEVLGQKREFFDYYKDIYLHGKSIEQAEYNNQYDLRQNSEGREVGRENPNSECGEILKGRIEVDWSKNN